MKAEIIEEEVGAIVVATGYDLYTMQAIGEYGGEKYDDVINGLQFERILLGLGPDGGGDPAAVRRQGAQGGRLRPVHRLARHGESLRLLLEDLLHVHGQARHALPAIASPTARPRLLHRRPDGRQGLRRVLPADRRGGQGPLHPGQGLQDLQGGRQAHRLGRGHPDRQEGRDRGRHGRPGHGHGQGRRRPGPRSRSSRSRPTSTASWPRPIPSCGRSRASTPGSTWPAAPTAPRTSPRRSPRPRPRRPRSGDLFAQKELIHEPTVVPVNDELCSGCGICVTMCPYDARTLDPDRGVVVVNEILCEGCGACAAACPTGAAQQRNQTDDQIFSMLRAMLRE